MLPLEKRQTSGHWHSVTDLQYIGMMHEHTSAQEHSIRPCSPQRFLPQAWSAEGTAIVRQLLVRGHVSDGTTVTQSRADLIPQFKIVVHADFFQQCIFQRVYWK